MNRQRKTVILAALCAAALILAGCARTDEGAQSTQPSPRQTAEQSLPDRQETPAPSETPAAPTAVSTPTPTPAPTPTPTPTPTPEPTPVVDPSSKLLPNLFTFLYHDRSYKTDGGHGRTLSCNGSHPGASFEGVREELLALLAEEQYQLELVDYWINPHYSGIEMHDYFYVYTGTAEGMETLVDKYEEHEFHVMLRITDYLEYGYFKLSIYYCNQFDVVDPGKRTAWDIEHDGEGGLLTSPPDGGGDSGSDFWEKCSACHGSGRCTHCGGDGEVKKFQAGLGWVELDCTLCNRGKCRHCNGTGKD